MGQHDTCARSRGATEIGRRIAARLRAESGMALIMALGILMVLTIVLAGVIVMTSASARHANTSNAGQKAYALAEAGLNNGLAQLAARYPSAESAAGKGGVPTLVGGPISYPGGTASWSGKLIGTTWTVIGQGTVSNPTGGASVLRAARAKIKVTENGTVVSEWRPYGLYAGDPTADCTTLSGGISVNVSAYAASCLVLTGNTDPPAPVTAKIWDPNYIVFGSTGKKGVATGADVTATTITRKDAGGDFTKDPFKVGQRVVINSDPTKIRTITALTPKVMTVSAPALTPIGANQTIKIQAPAVVVQVDGLGPFGSVTGLKTQGGMEAGEVATPLEQISAKLCTPAPCGPVNGQHALSYDLLPPLAMPKVDATAIYAEANWSSPTCASVPGGTPGFNPFETAGESPPRRNNSRNTTIPWTTSFDCTATTAAGGFVGRLKFDVATKKLNIAGKVFIDGALSLGTGDFFSYGDWADGTKSSGTIYFNNTVDVSGTVCGPGSTFDGVSGTCSQQWDPNLGSLLIVASNAPIDPGPPVQDYVQPTTLPPGGSNGWTKSSGSNGAPLLADGIPQPATPNTTTRVTSTLASENLDIGLPNTRTFDPGGTYRLWIYGSAGFGRRLDVQISNNNGATWQTVRTGVIGPGSADGWQAPLELYSPSSSDIAIGATEHLRALAVRLTSADTAPPTPPTLVASGSGTGATVTIPAHLAGDVVIVSAHAATVAPSVPANGGDFTWTSIQRSVADGVGLTTVGSVATGSATSTVTMAGAVNWVVHVYRAATGTLSLGASSNANNKNVLNIVYPSLALQNAGGTSTVYRVGARSTSAASVSTAPTGYTNRESSPAGTPFMASHDRTAVTANPTADSVTQAGIAAAYRAHSVEIRLNRNPVVVHALYLDAFAIPTVPGPVPTSFTLQSKALFEAGAWAIGDGRNLSPTLTSTGQTWLGGSVFTDKGYAALAGGGILKAFLALPSGAPTTSTVGSWTLDLEASEFG